MTTATIYTTLEALLTATNTVLTQKPHRIHFVVRVNREGCLDTISDIIEWTPSQTPLCKNGAFPAFVRKAMFPYLCNSYKIEIHTNL